MKHSGRKILLPSSIREESITSVEFAPMCVRKFCFKGVVKLQWQYRLNKCKFNEDDNLKFFKENKSNFGV